MFWTRLKSSCVLPLNEAKSFYRKELLGSLEEDPSKIDSLIKAVAARNRGIKCILHLSDLHFGNRETDSRRGYLKQELSRILPIVDRVVVTGDLLDTPSVEYRAVFDEFRADIEKETKKSVLVIPGNHDVRRSGIALGGLGRNSEHVLDLEWDPVVCDHELQTVFFSFNSNESVDFAKGSVSADQLRRRRSRFRQKEGLDQSVSSFMKIALVHHHPYKYDTAPVTFSEKIIASIFGSGHRFLAFDNAEHFMRWCAAQGISLVLHGHMHVPHLVKAKIASERKSSEASEVSVIGCGSTTGAGNRGMCFDVIFLDPKTKRWSVKFFQDVKFDGTGFCPQNVTIDLRRQ